MPRGSIASASRHDIVGYPKEFIMQFDNSAR
jgi:hypothetical protein